MSEIYDIAIIGLGPSGLEALDIALKNNLKVIVFEKDKIGGTCLNRGCIPTKAMIHYANLINEFSQLKKENIVENEINFSFKNIINKRDDIVSKFNKGLDFALSKKVQIIKAEAKLIVKNNLASIIAEDKIYQAKNIIVSTGSKPKEIKGLEFDNKKILSSDDIFKLNTPPKNLLIVGSGAIGLEIAYLFSKFNTNVTIVEMASNLAPNLDIDLSKRIERILKLNNIKFFKNDFIKEILPDKAVLNSGSEIEYDNILSAIGRKAILPEVLEGKIEDASNIYFSGDCLNDVMLAHKASFDAKKIMNKIIFNKEIKNCEIPKIIFLFPEIASCGIAENEADSSYEIKKLMLSTIAKAWCDNNTDGFIKVILKDNIIKGVHIVSKNASELITIAQLLIDNNYSKDKLLNVVFNHPSLSEMFVEVMKN